MYVCRCMYMLTVFKSKSRHCANGTNWLQTKMEVMQVNIYADHHKIARVTCNDKYFANVDMQQTNLLNMHIKVRHIGFDMYLC